MFDPKRWAQAFAERCGPEIGEGIGALRVFAAALDGAGRTHLAGSAGAARVEALFRAAIAEAGLPARPDGGMETALRFICLLVRKGFSRQRTAFLLEAERAADRAGGITRARLETALPAGADLARRVTEKLLEKTGAKEIVLELRVNPELLAGGRLHIGTDIFDASLRERLRRMERELLAGSGRRAEAI